VNLSELAERHGVNRSTAKRWKDKGIVVLGADGEIDAAASETNLRALQLGMFAVIEEKPAVTEADGTKTTLADVELRKQYALMRGHELEVAEEEGRLVDASVARTEASRIGRLVLDSLATMPARRSHEIADELGVDVGKVSAALEKHLRLELKAIADSL
jgi:phage terminase Nu1 subunit (DNA packaging protein)